MTTESPAVRELRRFLSLCGFADKADAVLAELAACQAELAHEQAIDTEAQLVAERDKAQAACAELRLLMSEQALQKRLDAAEAILSELAACQAERNTLASDVASATNAIAKLESENSKLRDSLAGEVSQLKAQLATARNERDSLMHEVEEIEEIVKERNAAQAAAAEMRRVLEHYGELSVVDDFGCLEIRTEELYQHALSTDCGRGYVSAVELERPAALLRDAWKLMPDCYRDTADVFLAEATRLEALKGGEK